MTINGVTAGEQARAGNTLFTNTRSFASLGQPLLASAIRLVTAAFRDPATFVGSAAAAPSATMIMTSA